MGYLRVAFWSIAGLAYPCGVGSAGQGGQPRGAGGGGKVLWLSPLSALHSSGIRFQAKGTPAPRCGERDPPEVESPLQLCFAQLAWR